MNIHNKMNNIAIFSRLIRSLLMQHNRVSLPGLGSFIAEDQPSELTDEGRLINAPTRIVTFSVKETWNDEVLEKAYATELEGAMLELEDDSAPQEQPQNKENGASKLFLEQAKREVASFVATIESQLQSSGTFQFPGFGTMTMEGKRQDITFLKSTDCDLAPDGFGLTSVSVKPLPAPSRSQKPLINKPKPPKREPKIITQTPSYRQTHKGTSNKSIFKRLLIALGILLVVFIVIVVLLYIFQDVPWVKQLLWWLLSPR